MTMTREQREELYGPILRAAFAAQKLPPSWGMCLARQESDFTPRTENQGPGDHARGGSWGLCQMSLKTAQSLGYTGDGPGLQDPATNARLAAKLCAQNVRSLRSRKLEDIAAAYNCGPGHVLAKTIPDSTRDKYVPNVMRFYGSYAHFDVGLRYA